MARWKFGMQKPQRAIEDQAFDMSSCLTWSGLTSIGIESSYKFKEVMKWISTMYIIWLDVKLCKHVWMIYSLFIILTAPFFGAKCHFSPCFLSRQGKDWGLCSGAWFSGFSGLDRFNWCCRMKFLPSRIGRCSGKSLSIWLPSQQTEPRLSQPAFSSKWPRLHIGNWICESTLAGSTV